MVQILKILEAKIDNKNNDELGSLKQAIRNFDWSKWKKAMKVEYDSLIENETWVLATT